MGFTEPDRSPGLLVSSYLTVSPLPRPKRKHPGRGGLFSVALSLSGPHVNRPRRWALPTIAPFGVRTFLRGMPLDRALGSVSPALSTNRSARRSSQPPRTSLYTLRRGRVEDNSIRRRRPGDNSLLFNARQARSENRVPSPPGIGWLATSWRPARDHLPLNLPVWARP